MKCRPNLYISRLLRVGLLLTVPAFMALAAAQMPPMEKTSPEDVVPSTGGRPEILTVLDMRKDANAADRTLAKSAQCLMNSEPLRTDKIYLVFSDQDQQWLDWLVKKQYILSTGAMHDMEELIRRYPTRDALMCDDTAPGIAAAAAGCDRLLLVTDPALVTKYHLNVRKDLRKKWKTTHEAEAWLLDNYGDKLNTRVVAEAPTGDQQFDLLDYQIANKMFSFTLNGDDSDNSTMNALVNRFDANIPCLDANPKEDQSTADTMNRAAKFVIPTSGLSNLSVWTTFRPHEPGISEINSGATSQPRAIYKDPYGVLQGGWFDESDRNAGDHLPWLRELTPPVYEDWLRQRNRESDFGRNSFRIGVVNEDVYGKAYGEVRDRIWTDYLELSRDYFDLASAR